jgi:uncharacterized protein (DUF433 family)
MMDAMFDRITVEPEKLGGQPAIRGMRVSVAHVVRLVAAGWTVDQMREELPDIEPEDVRQALLYAASSAEVTTLPLQQPA